MLSHKSCIITCSVGFAQIELAFACRRDRSTVPTPPLTRSRSSLYQGMIETYDKCKGGQFQIVEVAVPIAMHNNPKAVPFVIIHYVSQTLTGSIWVSYGQTVMSTIAGPSPVMSLDQLFPNKVGLFLLRSSKFK